MPRILSLLLLCLPLAADERWIEVKSGPFHILSSVGDKAARDQMTQLEQFRHAFGLALGKQDLKLLWPLRVVVGKKGAQPIGLARDGYIASTEVGGIPPERFRELAQLLLNQNTGRLPEEIERGLIELYSTFQVSGTHITLGAPTADRTRDWARMHLLSVDPVYAGRTRVMISNLEQGSDLAVAYRNAFEKSEAQIEKQVDAYLSAGQFGTTSVSARTLSPTRDLHVERADAATTSLAAADLLLAAGASEAEAAFRGLHGPEAAEGLALVALKAGRKAEAIIELASARHSGSKSARVWFESALLETDKSKAAKEFETAGEFNLKWGEPAFRWAALETDLDRRAILLKKAASLDARNEDYWVALAKNETAANRFQEAQKAWGGAERAAGDLKKRTGIRVLRLKLQEERADFEAAERQRRADEAAADLERVRSANLAEIRAAEDKASADLNKDGAAAPKPMDWFNAAEGSAKVVGSIQKIDCLGNQARLTVTGSDGKTVLLLVRDPGQIVLSGSGEMTLGCGAQKPARSASISYNPKPDKKMGTAGDIVGIEFR